MIREITREDFSLGIINKNLFGAKKGVYMTHMLCFYFILFLATQMLECGRKNWPTLFLEELR